LLRQIYERAVELYNRRVDFLRDRFHLVIPGNKDPQGGTLRGHIDQFENKQQNLNDLLSQYNKGKCGGRGGAPNEGSILQYARLMLELPVDLPRPEFGPDRIVSPSPRRPPIRPVIPIIPVDPIPLPIPGPVPIPIPVPIP
jgi:hypothetical protein